MGYKIVSMPGGGAPQGQAQPAEQPAAGSRYKILGQVQPRQYDDFRAPPPLDLSGYSKEQLLQAYQELPKEDPRREQVKQQIMAIGNEPFERESMSPWASHVAGITHGMSLGLSDEINAGIAGLTGGSYDAELQRQRQMMHNAEKDNPGDYTRGDITGMLIPAAVTLGASVPESAGARLGMNVLGGAAQNGIAEAGDSEGGLGDRLAAGAEGALIGGAIGVLPTVGEGVVRGARAVTRGAVKNIQKVTNPSAYVEKEIVDDIASDWRTQQSLDRRAAARGQAPQERRFLDGQDVMDAEGAGQRVMVADLGGDTLRRKLKAVDNYSPEGSRMMRGASALRQTDRGQRVADVVSDSFGDTLNPKTVRDDLIARAREENAAAYAAAEQSPDAAHLWNPRLQAALSSNAGKDALKKAIAASRDEAIRNGQPILEPIFEEGPDGLMNFTGRFRRPTGEAASGIDGLGLGLRFWDRVKRGFDDVIEGLPRDEAARVRGIKNDMVSALDQAVPEYATARGTARSYFGMEDAHEAGAAYFKNMNAYDTAEARQALQAMRPAERELFARGYAAELVNRITQMGQAEDVNKLFRSAQSRMKMRDALGDRAADQLEAYTHREMVQGLLGKHLGENSTTMQQAIAAEGLKLTAAAGVGTWTTGDLKTGFLAGLAMRGGYRFLQRRIIQRYATEMAHLATSEDPEVIARILNKVSRQTGYMDFSRAVAAGAQSLGGATARVEPRMPFASGGRVPFAGGDLVAKVAEAAGKLIGIGEEAAPAVARAGRSTVAHPVRKAFPGIYKQPGQLLEDVQVAPEDPALKAIFGVTRDDLFEMSKRKGTVKDVLGIESKAVRPSEATENIKTPRNARRLVNSLEAARSNEGLWKGMHGWYVMDPAYQYLVKAYGPEEAARLFTKFNTLTGMSSPGSEVVTELQRGSAANMMDNLGRFDEFMNKGGIGKELRGSDFPQELAAVDGHPYHSTSQAPAMEKYLRTGRVEMGSAKVPTYIASSMPEELGTFTDLPVADAHFTRDVGLPDTRTAEKVYDHSMTMGEYKSVAPWFRDEVAHASDLESVPAQAILWGLYGPQTGVTTAVGAPKLELLAKGIMETARRLGVSPEVARDLVLTGRAHAYEQGGLVSAIGAAHFGGSSGSGV